MSRDRQLGIDAFISHLVKISPATGKEIGPESHLVDDLEFEAVDFGRLGMLLYQHYGVAGFSTATVRPANLTVEGIFRTCVLAPLGADRRPPGRRSRRGSS